MYSEAETYYRIRLPQTQPIKRPQLLSSVTTRGAEKLLVNGKGVISAPINRQLATDKITDVGIKMVHIQESMHYSSAIYWPKKIKKILQHHGLFQGSE